MCAATSASMHACHPPAASLPPAPTCSARCSRDASTSPSQSLGTPAASSMPTPRVLASGSRASMGPAPGCCCTPAIRAARASVTCLGVVSLPIASRVAAARRWVASVSAFSAAASGACRPDAPNRRRTLRSMAHSRCCGPSDPCISTEDAACSAPVVSLPAPGGCDSRVRSERASSVRPLGSAMMRRNTPSPRAAASLSAAAASSMPAGVSGRRKDAAMPAASRARRLRSPSPSCGTLLRAAAAAKQRSMSSTSSSRCMQSSTMMRAASSGSCSSGLAGALLSPSAPPPPGFATSPVLVRSISTLGVRMLDSTILPKPSRLTNLTEAEGSSLATSAVRSRSDSGWKDDVLRATEWRLTYAW
mmetsp:Transcript_2980/g.7329  ORF Transcript_2980/g.7329 Transcript_2980/m.7329 type:complete len:361 (-) Transcript_2980:1477-2559(-)